MRRTNELHHRPYGNVGSRDTVDNFTGCRLRHTSGGIEEMDETR